MTHHELILTLGQAEIFACAVVLSLMVYRRQFLRYGFLSAYLGARLISDVFLSVLLQSHVFVSGHDAYLAYFYTYWVSYALEALLGFGIIYNVFRLAMAPLEGLQSLGNVMFRWAFGIAGALSLSVGLSAHVVPNSTAMDLVINGFAQLQKTESVLTLCMLLFVTMAIRPMGLSHRSKIFGVSLGLGILATSDLAVSAFGTANLDSIFEVIKGSAVTAALTTWIIYFALPEPKRRMMMLPTTSPFLRWNQIAEVLNDAPGFVAIGEVTPEMFAPAELEIMCRASAKMGEPIVLAAHR